MLQLWHIKVLDGVIRVFIRCKMTPLSSLSSSGEYQHSWQWHRPQTTVKNDPDQVSNYSATWFIALRLTEEEIFKSGLLYRLSSFLDFLMSQNFQLLITRAVKHSLSKNCSHQEIHLKASCLQNRDSIRSCRWIYFNAMCLWRSCGHTL